MSDSIEMLCLAIVATARHDWLQQLRFMNNRVCVQIMLMRLQQLCKSCRASCYLILTFAKMAKFWHSSCARILFYFIVNGQAALTLCHVWYCAITGHWKWACV